MNEKDFKKQNRKDVCSGCPKRTPCGTMDSICGLVTLCPVCEIKDTCTGECSQVKAYLSRGNQGRTGEILTKNIGSMDDFYSFQNYNLNNENIIERTKRYTINEVPWGSISSREKTLIIDYFLNRKTLAELSKEHSLTQGRISQLLFGSKGSSKSNKKKILPTWGALKTLREYITYRDLYTRYGHNLFPTQRQVIKAYYFDYKTVKEIAKETNTLTITVYKRLAFARKKLKKFAVSL